jgi:hypothetical protein
MTRCLIGFYSSAEDELPGFNSLLHLMCDGQPSAIFKMTKSILERGFKLRGNRPDQISAWLLYSLIAESVKNSVARRLKLPDSPLSPPDGIDFTGYGIVNTINDDAEYLYRINCDKQNILVYHCDSRSENGWSHKYTFSSIADIEKLFDSSGLQ